MLENHISGIINIPFIKQKNMLHGLYQIFYEVTLAKSSSARVWALF